MLPNSTSPFGPPFTLPQLRQVTGAQGTQPEPQLPVGETSAAAATAAASSSAASTRRAAWAPIAASRLVLGPGDEHLTSDPVREMDAAVVASVDLGAVRTNYRLAMQQFVGPDTKPSAVIKANGYGLDAGVMAKTLIEEGCRDFFVAHVSEAHDLRDALDRRMPGLEGHVSVMVLEGVAGRLNDAGIQRLIDNRITPVLNSIQQMERWAEAGQQRGRRFPAILQVESGMHRAGMNPEDLQHLLDNRPELFKQIDLKYVMSHLADAGGVETISNSFAGQAEVVASPASEKQRQSFERLFEKVRQAAPGVKACLGASSTVFLGESYHKDMIRLGGTFHGQAPISTEGNPYAPVLTLTTTIGELKELKEGEQVGYGYSFTAERDMRTATLPAGYADGLPRHKGGPLQPDGPYVLIGGNKAPVVGKTSMDLLVVDVTDVKFKFKDGQPTDEPIDLKEGYEVTLIGGPITTDHHGGMYGTNASETQVKLTGRVHVKYSDDVKGQAPDMALRSDIQSAW